MNSNTLTKIRSTPAIDVAALGVRFGELSVIENMNFTVQSGEFVSLLGPSGCGKSTLLRVLAGLIPVSSGAVRIGGQTRNVNDREPRVSLVFQKPLLLPWRTTLQNVLLPIEIERGGGAAGEMDIKRARKVLELVRLSDFADAYPAQLSGGMQQRAALARALISDPDMLLMDEPFGALDELTREALNDEVIRIWKSDETRLKTVVMVTHSIPEAAAMSDRVLILAPRPARLLEVVALPMPYPRDLESTEFIKAVGKMRDIVRSII
jgi:NitT/TauT family transport system ATP-binding protein